MIAFRAHLAAAALSLWAATAFAAQITRGPYLQSGGAQSVVVRWRTDVSTDSRVRYGPAPNSLPNMLVDPTSTTEHEVRVGALVPGTRIYYAVGSSAGDLAGGDAVTWYDIPPPPGTPKPFRAWILGDPGRENETQARVRDAYYAYTGPTRTDVWLTLGDNAYDQGTDAEYQGSVFESFAPFLRSHVLWSTRGNHDLVRVGPNNDYYDFFTLPKDGHIGGVPSASEAYYAFDYADAHFVCLDSEGSSNDPGDPMLTWLEADLAATQQRWIIAFWHRPPYSKGTHSSDTDSRMTEMREHVVPVLEAHGVDLVLTGHSHDYERSFLIDGHYGVSSTLTSAMIVDGGDGRIDGDGPYHKPAFRTPHAGAVYVVVGVSYSTAAAPLDHPAMVQSMSALGSLVLDVTAQHLDGRFLDDRGVVRDSFRIAKASELDSGQGASGLTLVRVGPHPARAAVTLAYRLPSAGRVALDVMDVAGRHVRKLVAADHPAGSDAVTWDGHDDAGRRVPPGVYFTKLEFGGNRRVVRVVLVD